MHNIKSPTFARQKPRRHATDLDINHLKLEIATDTSDKATEYLTTTETYDKDSPSHDLACYEIRNDNLGVDFVEEASTGSSDPSEGHIFIVSREQTKPI